MAPQRSEATVRKPSTPTHNGREAVVQFARYRLISISEQDWFDDAERQRVVSDMQREMPEFDVEEYFGTQPTIFSDYDFLVLAEEHASGKAIGVFGARWMHTPEFRLLYLWTAMISDGYRKSSLFAHMQEELVRQVSIANDGEVPSLIVTKTYNPRVYSLLRRKFSTIPGAVLYPEIPGPQNAAMQEIATMIAASLWPKNRFSPDTARLQGGQAAVSPNFFPRMEADRDEDVNRHFQGNLSRDDQIVCIVRTGRLV